MCARGGDLLAVLNDNVVGRLVLVDVATNDAALLGLVGLRVVGQHLVVSLDVFDGLA